MKKKVMARTNVVSVLYDVSNLMHEKAIEEAVR
jgi:hypothetical protein